MDDQCRADDRIKRRAGIGAIPSRSRPFWLGVAVIVVACLVRLPTLTWYSLNFDEGASLHYSNQSYAELFTHFSDLGIDRHPLFYYIVLKAWRQIAGDADIMLRLPSALAGILTVAILYGLGRRRLGSVPAGFAALLIAVSPLVVYQHQDARMYAQALLFAVLAMGAFWELLEKPRWSVAVTSCIALVLAGYSHVIAATLFPALGLSLIWTLLRASPERGRTAIFGIGTLGVSGAIYTPYVMNIVQEGRTGRGAVSLDAWLRTSLGAARTLMDYQTTLSFPGYRWCLLGLLAAVVGVAVYRSRKQGVTVALWFLTIMALTIFVTMRIDLFQPKVFVFGAVPLALLAAVAAFGETGSAKWYGIVPALAVAGLAIYGLSFQWRGGRQREDFRHSAQYLEQRVTERDTVVVHASWARFAFGHYYDDPFVHPFPNNVDTGTRVGLRLQPYLDSDVLWLVQAGVDLSSSAGDPQHMVERWLTERYPVVTAVFPSGVDVRGYATRYRFTALPDTAIPTAVPYSNGLKLVGYRLPMRELPARDRWLHPPSTWVPVTLYWSVTQPLDAEIDIAISLEDEQGSVWGGALPRTNDLRAFHPPRQWKPGEIVRWDFDVNTNAEVRPGNYKVVVRVFEGEDGQPLKHTGGEDWFILDRVGLR